MDLKIFSLGSNPLLTEGIIGELGCRLGEVELSQFADGEQYVQFKENLRSRKAKVFLIQSTNQPDGNIIRLLIGLDAVCRAGGCPIAVIPYFGYSRQERKSAPREPITASLLAYLLEKAGAKGVLTMDLHANAIEGFFRTAKFDQIYARPVLLKFFEGIFADQLKDGNLVIASPDASGAGPGRARSYAKHLGNRTGKNVPLVVLDKRRDEHNDSEVNYVLGEVKNKTVIFIDDILDTGGTLIKAAQAVFNEGAKEIYAAAVHGLFSRDALEKIKKGVIKKVFVTDTIYNENVLRVVKEPDSKIEIVSVAKIFAEAIRSINNDESVSRLFD